MIIVSNFDVIAAHADELVESGFGFSTLCIPSGEEPYNRVSMIEVLEDWGWSGSAEEKPAWLP